MNFYSFLQILPVTSLLLFLILSSCSPIVVEKVTEDDTPRCHYMADVCKDAEDFSAEYHKLSAEEKEEMKVLYSTLQEQCADAVEACKKSRKEDK